MQQYFSNFKFFEDWDINTMVHDYNNHSVPWFQNTMVLPSDTITVPLEPLLFFVDSNHANNVQHGMFPCHLNIVKYVIDFNEYSRISPDTISVRNLV